MFFFFAGTVQAGQKAPARFEAVAGSGGVIVRDNNTGLEWQRCPYGQSWTGSGCSGAAWRGVEGNLGQCIKPDRLGWFQAPDP